MWFLHIKNETKWFITDIDHQNRLLKDSEYEVIEEVKEPKPTLDLDTLEYKELQAIGKEKGLKHTRIKKEDLLESIKNLKEGE
ncbi:hypothetical protein [Clostridium tagluense]|uniref:hypothetical protein n=1 Tax=Clostridium tagluense TaxID=360422 RepID=UPI001CF24CAC|nr:hypothetical protein [Clostridium tagluense]MCB2297044.1 hypothetical protein [Clostridium tagluense]